MTLTARYCGRRSHSGRPRLWRGGPPGTGSGQRTHHASARTCPAAGPRLSASRRWSYSPSLLLS